MLWPSNFCFSHYVSVLLLLIIFFFTIWCVSKLQTRGTAHNTNLCYTHSGTQNWNHYREYVRHFSFIFVSFDVYMWVVHVLYNQLNVITVFYVNLLFFIIIVIRDLFIIIFYFHLYETLEVSPRWNFDLFTVDVESLSCEFFFYFDGTCMCVCVCRRITHKKTQKIQ